MSARDEVVQRLAGLAGDACRIGIDGVDAAGKSTLAAELAAVLALHGARVARVALDDFLPPPEERYRHGRDSPEGYYLDSFDHEAFREAVLHAPGTVVADGVFLQRAELDDLWDFRIFVDVPFEEVLRRADLRDPADVRARYERRYIPAQERYLRERDPRGRADAVLDNTEPARPRLRVVAQAL